MNKKFVILSILVALLIVGAITVSSYAYFTIANGTGTESVITSGNMALTLTDGAKITTGNMIPGDYIEKEFSVENTGNIATSYDVYLSEVINTFVDKTDFVYEITSLDGGYNTSSQVQLPSVSTKIINHQAIEVGVTHHYKLKITFLAKNENQDDNQGRVFSGTIQVNEYKDVETTVNYYLNNNLVQNIPENNGDNQYINYTCTNNATITFDTTNWTYEVSNVTSKNTTCNLYFEYSELTLISVTTNPTKMEYDYGENLDLTGIVITATYEDNTTKTKGLSNLTSSPTNGTSLTTTGNNTITISYTENGITKSTYITINVKPMRIAQNANNTLPYAMYDGDLSTSAYTSGVRQKLYLPSNTNGKKINIVFMFDYDYSFFNIEFKNSQGNSINQTKNNITEVRSCYINQNRSNIENITDTMWYCGIVNGLIPKNTQYTGTLTIPNGTQYVEIYTGDDGPVTKIYDIYITD